MKMIYAKPAILIALVVTSCAASDEWHENFALGTVCRIKFYERVPKELPERVFARLNEIENTLSATRPESALEKVNAAAGVSPVPAPPELRAVTERALYFANLSDGAFDPTIGPLVRLWGIGTENERVPSESETAAALSLTGREDVVIDNDAGTMFLKRAGMRLDLGAIAKGYSADEIVRLLKSEGARSVIIDLGGNIYAMGTKKDGGTFKIGVQSPDGERGNYLGIVTVKNKSIVTSGTYERYFEKDGTRYHHILSTKTGFPVNGDLISVTIVSDSSMDADALSTSVFALGYEKGLELLNNFPQTQSVLVLRDNSVKVSAGLASSWQTGYNE